MMGRALLIISGMAVLASRALVNGIALSWTEYPTCGYVGGQIYCFGSVSAPKNQSDTHLFSLNVVKFSGQTTDSMRDKWEAVQLSTPFDVESRFNPTAIVLSDGKKFLIQGGSNTKKTKFANQTIVYDTTTNSWKNASASQNTKQIYHSSAVILPNNNVGFYGGLEQNLTRINSPGEGEPLGDNNTTSIDFRSSIQMYSPEEMSWAPFNPSINNPTNYYPNSQTATLDPVSGIVYYLGGSYYKSDSDKEFRVSFGWAYTFNSKSLTWSTETFEGDAPSERMYHSANLLPNSRDIFVYGGTNDGARASADYCYTLNLGDKTWTNQSNLNIPSDLSGPRYSHSSVLVDTTLFILFGKGSNGTFQSSLISIDVADVANIHYTSTFNTLTPPNNITIPPSNNTSGNDAKSSSSSGLSKGAIGGIAAGIAVVALFITAGAVFCVRRSRKSDRYGTEDNYNEYATEKIHVTWNKVDNQYRDIPPVSSSVTNFSQPVTSLEATRIETPSLDVAPTLRSQYIPNLANINVVEDDDFSVVDEHNEKNPYSTPAYS